MQQDWTLGTEMLWWQATSTKECTSANWNARPTGSQHGKSRHLPRSHNCCPGRCGKTDALDVGEDHSPQDEIALYDIQANVTPVATAQCYRQHQGSTHIWWTELFIDAINYGTIGNTHPKEIMVGDVHAPLCNEAYTTVQLPASASRKGTASLHASRSTQELKVMCCPSVYFNIFIQNQISPAGLPTGLDHASPRLTAYNRSHIPPIWCTLCGPITWQSRLPWCSTPPG